ncbi:listeria-bacteroides repeat domain (list_Bact_rpt) [mine drainage metagenome]|uniref:Listeria-bacteroides repeat domain (List_Bact_rpt) n=1 Tax=mine drainage metagenome TaxID=410659 RepID=A0A1J5Q4I9_9ZZZZ
MEDGSGTTYAVGATFSISSDMVLYAAWSATVTYVANGATGGTVPVDSGSPYMNGSTVTVLGNTGSLVKTGYTFVHWHTTTDVSTIHYAPGDSFVITANTVLYAAWVPEGSRTIAYNANGATGGRAPTDTASPYLEDSMVTVLGNTGLLTRAGYTFANWNTVSNGSGTAYSGGDTFAIAYNTILYAQWTPETTTYTVTFNGNGSTSGSTAAQMAGVSTPLVSNGFLRFGYVFAGWNTSPEGSGAAYADGAVYSFASDATLYAQWALVSRGDGAPPVVAPPTATVDVPVTQIVSANAESRVEASIPVSGGFAQSVSVVVPVGAVPENVTISIAPAESAAAVSSGLFAIKVTATNAAGVFVTHFNKPLVLNLGQMAAGTTVAFSQDGFVWTNIQLLSGTTLPDGVHEGYYLAADGSVMILTDHLTYFGLKMAQTPLVLHANSNQIPLGAFAAIYTTGGSGSGTGTYLTTPPAICSVNQYGLVIGLKAGKCTVLATKAGDGTYLNASTAPLDLIYIDLTPTLPVLPSLPSTGVPVSLAKSVTITGVTLSKLILVNLGAPFGGKTVTIQIRKVGTATYQTLCVVTLNKAGVVRTTRRIPLGSTIRVLLGGKSQAVTVVR